MGLIPGWWTNILCAARVWLKETTQNTFHGWIKYMLYIKLNERWFPLSIAYWLIEEWISLAVIWKGRWYSQEHCGCAARGPRVRSIPPINGGVRRALEEVALKPWEDAGAGVLEEGVSLKDLGILLFYVSNISVRMRDVKNLHIEIEAQTCNCKACRWHWAVCYGLNVSPQNSHITTWYTASQSNGVRRGAFGRWLGLDEVVRVEPSEQD